MDATDSSLDISVNDTAEAIDISCCIRVAEISVGLILVETPHILVMDLRWFQADASVPVDIPSLFCGPVVDHLNRLTCSSAREFCLTGAK